MTIRFSIGHFFPALIVCLLLSFTSFAGFKMAPAASPTVSSSASIKVRVTFRDVVRLKVAQIKSSFAAQPDKHTGNGTPVYGIAAASMGVMGILLIVLGLLAMTAGIFLVGTFLAIAALPVGIIGCIGRKRMKGLAILGIGIGTLALCFLLLILAAAAAFT